MDPNVYGTNTTDQPTEEQKDGIREQEAESDPDKDGLEEAGQEDPRETDTD